MLITASVPAYNSESTIKETILSLANQSYPFSQIKIYDNKSTDNTRSVIKELMKDVRNLILIENEENVGGEGNFTKCIGEAEGDLCVVAHADDIYHKDFAKKNVELFESDSNLSGIFCAANEIDGYGEVIGKRYVPSELRHSDSTKLSKEEAIKLFYKYGNFVTCPSVVVRSNIFREKIKIWDGSTYKTSADLDVWFRLLDVGNLGFINDTLINYRVADASYSYRVAKVRTEKHDIFKVLEAPKNARFAKDNQRELNFLLNKDFANRFLNTIRAKDLERVKAYSWDCDFDLTRIIKMGFASGWHLKMMSAVLVLRMIYKIKRVL